MKRTKCVKKKKCLAVVVWKEPQNILKSQSAPVSPSRKEDPDAYRAKSLPSSFTKV